MREKYKISIVSFLNTLPFRYALSHNEEFLQIADIEEDIPSVCAKKLIEKDADIGLIPIAALPDLDHYHIISNYCIGAKQQVDSVFLFSERPMHELKRVLLDYRSRTSVQLVQILAEKFWNVDAEYISATHGYESQISGDTGAVVIGDKALELLDEYPYQYDLAKAWFDYTGEEFVFAAWVSLKSLPESFLNAFDDVLKSGVQQVEKSIEWGGKDYPNLPLENYLKNRIDYDWNDSKRKSLQLFLSALTEIHRK